MALLEDDDEQIDRIYIEPADAAVQSDGDFASEDEGGLIDNLTGRQLRSGAEVVLADGERMGGAEDLLTDAEEPVSRPTKKSCTKEVLV